MPSGSWGLDARLETYRVLFPTPRERRLELVAPERFVASLEEPTIDQDPDSSDAGQLPPYNAYSADGDVTAQLVYVNYGIPSDYDKLRELGIDVQGKIVIVRYGASWRGIKPKLAAEHGAVGCIIYSDPKDDGFFLGDVFPEGPYRPEGGVQRGSVMDMPIHPGDPLTPGVGATADVERLARENAQTLVKIPVLPISWGDALPLLKNIRGPIAPESWRGSLPMTYHVGPGPARVHLKITSNWDLVDLYNVVARIQGSTYPDEWIIQGNHHDAWVNGANDPTSGMVTILEQARAFGELLKQSWRPRRTIILAAWDGEEQGLLGSTEWAEHHADELGEKAVIYLNTDSTGKGWLGVSGSHSLERFVHEVAMAVKDPVSERTVYAAALDRKLETAESEVEKRKLREREDLRIGALGSGSDYTVFIDFLGIAALNLGFSGASNGGVYHSAYDSFTWYTRFADTTFEYGRALAQLNGIALMRLADASVLPFRFINLADTIGIYLEELEELSSVGEVDLDPLSAAQKLLANSADAFEKAYQDSVASGDVFQWNTKKLQDLNRLLYQSERMLTNPRGLPKRPWFKHQIYAPGLYTGYGVKTVPWVREALEREEWDEADEGVKVVGESLTRLSELLESATRLLR